MLNKLSLILISFASFYLQADEIPERLKNIKVKPASEIEGNFIGNIRYITNRRRLVSRDGKKTISFGAERPFDGPGPFVSMGTVNIHYPKAMHKRGSLEKAKNREAEKNAFRIINTYADVVVNENLEVNRAKICAGSEITSRKLLIFIHGFNNTLEDAVLQAAQMQLDLPWQDNDHELMVLSWPSFGEMLMYLEDVDQVMSRSKSQMQPVLQTLRECWGDRLNFIVHSMGNRFFLRTIQGMIQDDGIHLQDAAKYQKMGRLVLAAPDVSNTEFIELAPKALKLFHKVVHLYSTKDRAVFGSELIRLGEDRAGCNPISLKNLESISVDNVNNSDIGFGHSYFAASEVVLNDIIKIFTLPLNSEEMSDPTLRGPIGKSTEGTFFYR